MAYCKWLKEISSQPELGAAAKLASLLKAGQPVSPGFVITDKAFDDFVAYRKIDLTKKDDFVNTSLNGEMQSEIVEFYKYIDAAEDLKYVKSAHALLSATARDMPFVSVSAGSKRFTNLKGIPALTKAIQECWATTNGGPVSVLVTKQLNAERSGTVTQKNNQFEVKASWGHELISPSTYLLDADDKVVGFEVPGQQIQIVRDDYSSGSLRKEVPKDKQGVRVLSDNELGYLAKLARDVSEKLGDTNELHWQMEKYRLYLTDVREVSLTPREGEEKQHPSLRDSPKSRDDEYDPEPMPEPEPTPQPMPDDDEDEDEPEEAPKPEEVLLLRMNTSENYDLLKQEIGENKNHNIMIQVTSREQVEALRKIAQESNNIKILLPQYLQDLILELKLDKNKFCCFEDKSL